MTPADINKISVVIEAAINNLRPGIVSEVRAEALTMIHNTLQDILASELRSIIRDELARRVTVNVEVNTP